MVCLLMEPTLITDIMKTVNFVYHCILSRQGGRTLYLSNKGPPSGPFGAHRKQFDAINVDRQREGGLMVTPPKSQLAWGRSCCLE